MSCETGLDCVVIMYKSTINDGRIAQLQSIINYLIFTLDNNHHVQWFI